MKNVGKLESIMWNIALPGFSQILTGHYIKGILFILSEVIINLNSHFNLAIMFSFLGEFEKAYSVTNYQWLLFYSCLYFFAMWDGYRTAMPPGEQLSFLPFVFSAYLVTVGLFYCSKLKLFGHLIGPVFMPMLFVIPGLILGFTLRYIILKISKRGDLV
ncbi:hypothetical protein KDJ21_017575 [Metabacillus litoralis]|uniref:hypothetical protein n=1 Tax=Metabacillus litoralis TaxID=152268 RepID=UPI000EF62F7C|nr:hypothetical protein [Metabacillus litoralis]MCM3163541.1 hypothetical protein [Metabacillus litoralis]MCM3409802.1 hypothetical protein [Metabacillus litoralis]UHA58632.1 hypothetical protein KDJ21_017575 [Metabacillus litoralis]